MRTAAVRWHAFTNETKDRGYLMVAALLPSTELGAARQSMRSLIMPRQRRIHFHKEGNGRRKQILDLISALGVQAIVYDARRHQADKAARGACLTRLVADLVELDVARLVLETEDFALKFDKTVIFAELRAASRGDAFEYTHMRAYEETLLAIPDAIAWCWAKGGHWRTRVSDLITEVRKV